jgi:DNA-binding NarL/FixJ family response regulator
LLENERNDMQQKIRLMLVEDEAIVNEAICALLEMEESIAVVGKAATAATAVQQAHLLKPDVLLLDLHLPDRPGVEVIVELMGDNPALRILILTAYAADDEVVAAFRDYRTRAGYRTGYTGTVCATARGGAHHASPTQSAHRANRKASLE